MAIKVIDSRRFNTINTVSNIPTPKEVVMSKENAIVVKQSNPKQEEKAVKKQEEIVPMVQIPAVMWQQMIQEVANLKKEIGRAYNRGLSTPEVPAPTKHKEVKKQVIRINAETVSKEVAPVKVKADMHEAGFKAIETRMVNYVHKRPAEVLLAFKGAKVGEVRKVLVDKGMPTQKELRMRLDKIEGRYHGFTLKVETKAGPRYPKLAFQF